MECKDKCIDCEYWFSTGCDNGTEVGVCTAEKCNKEEEDERK